MTNLLNNLQLQSVWPEEGMKSSQIFPKSRPKSSHIRLYSDSNTSQMAQKIFGILLQENSSPRPFKNSPIWSHWLQFTTLALHYSQFSSQYDSGIVNYDRKMMNMMRVAVIAPWFRLRLPSCGPGFESKAHHTLFLKKWWKDWFTW